MPRPLGRQLRGVALLLQDYTLCNAVEGGNGDNFSAPGKVTLGKLNECNLNWNCNNINNGANNHTPFV